MNDVVNHPDSGNSGAVVLFAPSPVTEASPAWTSLDERGLLRVDGEDAETFLQGQLTQDMARVRAGDSLLAAHCSAKGRVTALFRAWHDGQALLLDLPAELAAAAQRRLGMYVLRSRVVLAPVATSWMRTGVQGAALAEPLRAFGFEPPEPAGTIHRVGEHRCIALGHARWLVVSPAGNDGGLRAQLAARLAEDPEGWRLGALRAGTPEVLAATVDHFVPQMLNLDTLDGISFRKGCYTGQEIVARAHYLGRVKRRMQHFAWRGALLPAPGTSLPIADRAEGAQAELVWALQTHADGGEALAVAATPEAAEARPDAAD